VTLDAALATYIDQATMSPSRPKRAPQVIVMTIATSETTLPPDDFSLVREVPTYVPAYRQIMSPKLEAAAVRLQDAVDILPISEEAEEMVAQLMMEHRPKATTRKILSPRRK